MIQIFIQWNRDMLRTGRDPSLITFPSHEIVRPIRNYKSHKTYVDNSKTVSEAAKHVRFNTANKKS